MRFPHLVPTYLAAVVFWLPAPSRGEMRAGAAAVGINPAPGTPFAGYYSLRPAAGVLDEIFAKALVFEEGGQRPRSWSAIS